MPGVIKINPAIFNDKRDARAVAFNEGLRLFQDDHNFNPDFEVTQEQRTFFKDTGYATDLDAMKKTIVARIATHDTSVSPTPEQEQSTVKLLDQVMGTIGKKHPDYSSMLKMRDSVRAGNARGKMRKAPAGGADSTQAAGGAGDVRAADGFTPGEVPLGKMDPATWGIKPDSPEPSIRAATMAEIRGPEPVQRSTSGNLPTLWDIVSPDIPRTGNRLADSIQAAIGVLTTFGPVAGATASGGTMAGSTMTASEMRAALQGPPPF